MYFSWDLRDCESIQVVEPSLRPSQHVGIGELLQNPQESVQVGTLQDFACDSEGNAVGMIVVNGGKRTVGFTQL